MISPKSGAVALILALAPQAVLARPGQAPAGRETLVDNMRCDALTQQFDKAAASRPLDGAAKKQASQGAVLCRAGRYGEGAETLDKAVRMIGEAPAK
jgi:hypothetical protein